MKVTCLQENFARGLGMVSRAVAARSVLPVLGNVLVSTDEGRLKLAATNLELGITSWIGAKVEQAGSTTVPARILVDFVNTLPNEQVNLALDTRRMVLKLRCAAFSSEIKCMDAQEFPVLPTAGPGEGMALNVDALREMIAQVVLAAATDDTRPILTGVLVRAEGETLTMAAADGFRLSVRTSKLSAAVREPVKVIVPARALNELARLVGDQEELVWMFLPAGRAQVIFRLKEAELSSSLIEGNFPDFQPIIPKSFATRTVMTTAQFLKACKAADIFARQASHSARLKVTPGAPETPGNLEVMAAAAETGEGETQVEASVEGQPIEIAFNVRYLVEVLSVLRSPNVALETSGPASPGVIKPVGSEEFLHVIMPMHLGH